MPNPFLLQRYGAALLHMDPVSLEDATTVQTDSRYPSHGMHSSAALHSTSAIEVPIIPLGELSEFNYFVRSLDDDDDDAYEGVDAGRGYSSFPNAVHMMHTVFQPSRPPIHSSRVEEVAEELDSERLYDATTADTHPPRVPSQSHRDPESWMHDARSFQFETADVARARQREIEDLIAQTRAAMKSASSLVAADQQEHPQQQPAVDDDAPEVRPSPDPQEWRSSGSDAHEVVNSHVEPPAEHTTLSTEAATPTLNHVTQTDSVMRLPPTEACINALNDSKLNISEEHHHVAPPTAEADSNSSWSRFDSQSHSPVIVLLPSQDAADAAWAKHARRVPPSIVAEEPKPTARVAQQIPSQEETKSKARISKDRKKDEKRHQRKRETKDAASSSKAKSIPVEAIGPIMDSVYAWIAKSEGQNKSNSTTQLTTHLSASQAQLQSRSSPLVPPEYTVPHPSSGMAREVNPYVTIERSSGPQVIPAALSRFAPSPQAAENSVVATTTSVVSSTSLPRVGLGGPSVLAAVPVADNTKVDVVTRPAVNPRLLKPTESWTQRGAAEPRHLQPSAGSTSRVLHPTLSDPLIVSTSQTKQERIAHLNEAARRLARHTKPKATTTSNR